MFSRRHYGSCFLKKCIRLLPLLQDQRSCSLFQLLSKLSIFDINKFLVAKFIYQVVNHHSPSCFDSFFKFSSSLHSHHFILITPAVAINFSCYTQKVTYENSPLQCVALLSGIVFQIPFQHQTHLNRLVNTTKLCC